MRKTGLVKCLVFDEVYDWGKKRNFCRLGEDFNLAAAMHAVKNPIKSPLLCLKGVENFKTVWKELEV